MSRLKDVEVELAKMKKELESKEAEIRRKKAEPLADIYKDAILDDNNVCRKLLAYGKEEVRVIAKYFVWDMDRIIAESGPEIEALRLKRAARAARRRRAAAQERAAGSGEAVHGTVRLPQRRERASPCQFDGGRTFGSCGTRMRIWRVLWLKTKDSSKDSKTV